MAAPRPVGHRRRRSRVPGRRPQRRAGWLLAVALLSSGLPAYSAPPAAGGAEIRAVEAAIERMRTWLLARQQEAGHWENTPIRGSQYGGETALVVLALLLAGDAYQAPALSRALSWMVAHPPRGTYAASLYAQVWARLPDQPWHRYLEREARWLMDAADRRGRFHYVEARGGFDHSNTHYGILGLRAAAHRGVEVPEAFWERIREHFLAARDWSGGWGYKPGSQASGSMTSAGITALAAARAHLDRQRLAPEPETEQAIADGLAWLEARFTPESNPGGTYPYYYLYGIERAGLATGRRVLSDRDWYRAGARSLIERMGEDGGIEQSAYKTAFALAFLARGRYPVWVSRLRVPGWPGARRPMALARLTDYLSHMRERTYHWQSVSIDRPPASWLNAPVAWIAGKQPLELTPDRAANLRRFLAHGGLLVASPDEGSGAFVRAIRALGESIVPGAAWRPLPPDHPVYRFHVPVEADPDRPLHAIGRGVRPWIILADRDWGYTFQAQPPGSRRSWSLMANLFLLASDRGRLAHRLASPAVAPSERAPARTLTVYRPQHAGAWLPEPATWSILAPRAREEAGLAIEVSPGRQANGARPITLADLPDRSGERGLVHLCGIDPVDFTEAELAALLRFARQGGTVLIETVGGRGRFALELEKAITRRLENAPLPLAGRALAAGALPAATAPHPVHYTPRTALLHGPRRRLALAAWHLDGRPAIIVSSLDLSLSATGSRWWPTFGYERESARRILLHLAARAAGME